MALAVVASPIPSGPIALAAGALFGAVEGGLLSAVGAWAGAIGAFAIARRFGHRRLSAQTRGIAAWISRPRSQGALMALVFVSRLVPVISFDAVSYVAGLTCLALWRFALATLAGVVPIALVFAWRGEQAAGAGAKPSPLALALACGLTVALPLGVLARRTLQRFGLFGAGGKRNARGGPKRA